MLYDITVEVSSFQIAILGPIGGIHIFEFIFEILLVILLCPLSEQVLHF